MASSDPRDLVGQVVADRYRVQDCLGTGTMGAVYRAEHIHMKKTVAIKILHPSHTKDPEVVERFQREGQAAANIVHPNICQATDFGKLDEDFYYLVMEYLDGRPLIDAIKAGESFSVDRALKIGIQICSALARAHELGVVHRDLKPENILLVEKDDDPEFVKITDFGVARVRMSKDMAKLTQAGVVYGSPLYMSPQQAAGKEIDHRADLYSLGIILYELLTGDLPFYAKSLPIVLNMHISDDAPPFEETTPQHGVDPELEAVVMKLLEKNPDDRFQSADALRERLEEIREKLTASSRSSSFLDAAVARMTALPESTLRKIGIGAGALVGALMLVWGIALVASAVSSDETADEAAAEQGFEFDPNPVSRVEDERRELATESEIAAANELVEDDPQTAVEKLVAARERRPANAHIRFFLARAYAANDEWNNAADEFAEAMELDPRYAGDVALQGAVFKRFESSSDEEAEPARRLIEKYIREQGVTRLAELAEHHKVRKIRKRALAALRETGLFESLPRWNQLTIELRHAVGCETNLARIQEIVRHGDPRALAALRRFSALPKTGCGPDGEEDCYGCLRKELRLGIEELRARQVAPPPRVEDEENGDDEEEG